MRTRQSMLDYYGPDDTALINKSHGRIRSAAKKGPAELAKERQRHFMFMMFTICRPRKCDCPSFVSYKDAQQFKP